MNQKNLDALLSMTSKKFGTTPDELKKSLQNGNLDSVMKGMRPEDSASLQKALSDKNLINKIMSTPEAQELMKKMAGKEK